MEKELGKDREEFQFWAVMYLYELSDILIWATIIGITYLFIPE